MIALVILGGFTLLFLARFVFLTSIAPAAPPPSPTSSPHEGLQAGQQGALHMHVLVCTCSNVRQFFRNTLLTTK